MNATRTYRSARSRNVRACRYPNAAARSYYIDRLTDRLLCASAWIGIVVTVFFIATM